jgi:hypothetical protein
MIVEVDDLPLSVQSHELVDAMLAGANAKAVRVAPCLSSTSPAPTPAQLAEARLVLIGAIQRWAQAGAGAFQAQTAGPFGYTVDTRQRTGFNLWPSEIEALQEVCAAGTTASSGAFSIRPSRAGSTHAEVCALYFGALYCSCGSDLTGFEFPLYEGGVLTDGGGL